MKTKDAKKENKKKPTKTPQEKKLAKREKKTAGEVEELMKSSGIPETDWLVYFDRAKLFGRKAANDWMLGK